MRVADLCVGYSPRRDKLDEGHVLALMEVIDQLPPIVVDKKTMSVIDGVHRLEAFRRAGRGEVKAVFFSGNETEVLVLAIRANVGHGKPLTLGERQSAAARLLYQCPDWSDRRVAEICALAHSTVAGIRKAVGANELSLRVGRDGRRRRADPNVDQGPNGHEPVPRDKVEADLHETTEGAKALTGHRAQEEPLLAPRLLRVASTDRANGTRGAEGALRPGPERQKVCDWLARTAFPTEGLEELLNDLPLSRVYEVADECRRRSRTWAEIADLLENKVRSRQGNVRRI